MLGTLQVCPICDPQGAASSAFLEIKRCPDHTVVFRELQSPQRGEVTAMTEYLADSPVIAHSWCPGCEPLRDPTLEILDVRYCDSHAPKRGGADDTSVRSESYASGSTEAGGESNRLWCELFHGKERGRG